MKVVGLVILTLLSVLPDNRKCSCQPALESDLPHGANEAIEYKSKTVSRIHGRVTLPNGEPVQEAVVEVYDCPDRDKDKRAYEIVESGKRRMACLSDEDGNFCFMGLPSGWYVLRVGTRASAGMDESYVKVRLDRTWRRSWLRSGRALEVRMHLGT